ncbi:hypothetical protein LCY76_22455 [Fictibacillus sp. KIGAM418]|uniref:DUF697 domain-containing protein n=1 Tax=Fictibacillus marinisediminis TaxID=2878389 RepID=A0A9X1XES7_9BACL|nr:hypothetical protein [Fictibacillus marinisediminis]MCK6259341.1 hypothetical protein [Fictibacillus marinisediminis]
MIPKTIEELEAIRTECRVLVNKRASASAAAAVIPVPGVDVGADITIMMQLLPAINEKFGLAPSQIEKMDATLKGKIIVLITSAGSQFAGRVVTKQMISLLLKKAGKRIAVKQVTKFVPFVGQAVAAGISFAAMKYLGNSHIEECYQVCKKMIEDQQLPAQ